MQIGENHRGGNERFRALTPGITGREFPLECPSCGGDIRLFAIITDPSPFQKILTHLGEKRRLTLLPVIGILSL